MKTEPKDDRQGAERAQAGEADASSGAGREAAGKSRRKKKVKHTPLDRVLTAIGAVLCVVLLPILIINCTLIVKSLMYSDEVPSVGGIFPLIVMTDSMYPEIQSGDLIICRTADADEIEVGDVIAFFDPTGESTSVITHRVTEVTEADGVVSFHTKGDANNVEDTVVATEADLVGVYRFRIAGAGNVAMFMQTTTGLIVCVICPILLLIIYDVVRRRIYERGRRESTEELMEELEALREEKRRKEGGDS